MNYNKTGFKISSYFERTHISVILAEINALCVITTSTSFHYWGRTKATAQRNECMFDTS